MYMYVHFHTLYVFHNNTVTKYVYLHVHVCCVALPCCLVDLALLFPLFSSLINPPTAWAAFHFAYIYIYIVHILIYTLLKVLNIIMA